MLLACAWLLAGLLLAAPRQARADTVDLPLLEAVQAEDGVLLSFTVRYELSKSLEQALLKGVPLYFVAEAHVYQRRWYWRDKRVGSASRTWRLAYQPLTRRYRIGFSGLSQSYDRLDDAVQAMQQMARWKIADEPRAGDDGYYVEFGYRMDMSQLPRPLQIGFGGEADWSLSVERKINVANEAPAH
ncbi:MAG TPA: DUF4390 domain-containing protein [Methylibium sp.]